MNSEGRYTLMNKEGEKVRIYNNGMAFYAPGGTFRMFCELNLKMFPFDTQICSLKIESWRYTHEYMQFQIENNITFQYFSVNEQWDIVDTWIVQENLVYLEPWNSFDHIEFFFKIKRKIMYYM